MTTKTYYVWSKDSTGKSFETFNTFTEAYDAYCETLQDGAYEIREVTMLNGKVINERVMD